MGNTKTITALNKLVEIHNAKIDGYETSAKVADDPELKILYSQLVCIRAKCRQQLAAEIRRIGGIPKEFIAITDRFFRAWMDVNDVITGKDRKYFLDTCEFSEGEAISAYEAVLKDDDGYLSPEQKSMIHKQHILINSGYDKIKLLKAAQLKPNGNDLHVTPAPSNSVNTSF